MTRDPLAIADSLSGRKAVAYVSGFSPDTLTIPVLTLAIGIAADNAIMAI
ncbi:MAG: hypothetical protein HY788_17895 [Deltaproteobacteria bacterium]|nr:hypothetical protein [Deltaproteobacteria bacterium]